MCNRFKFRLWHVVDLKYIYSDGFGHMRSFWREVEDVCPEIVEQCTGLKDKTGKLIYEGDIVRADGEVASVYWDDTGLWSTYFPDAENIRLLCCTVIGNIHENPELMYAD